MFSGLIEQISPALKVSAKDQNLHLILKRPPAFQNLKEGESICVDGVCLTLEKFDNEKMFFSAGPETLKITHWTEGSLKNKTFHLERSLTLQSAMGGHLVTGHVDGLALVQKVKPQGDSRIVQLQVPKKFKNFFWKKGYIALNGISLTINQIQHNSLELCLIPKTLQLTNLSHIKKGDLLNFEVDYMSRPLVGILKSFYKQLFWLCIFGAFILLICNFVTLLILSFI